MALAGSEALSGRRVANALPGDSAKCGHWNKAAQLAGAAQKFTSCAGAAGPAPILI